MNTYMQILTLFISFLASAKERDDKEFVESIVNLMLYYVSHESSANSIDRFMMQSTIADISVLVKKLGETLSMPDSRPGTDDGGVNVVR